MRTPDIVRDGAFRAALFITLATIAATFAIFGFVYLQIIGVEEASARRVISEEANRAVDYSEPQLRDALELRVTRDLRRLDYVALFAASGRMAFGNVGAMPAIPADGKPHLVDAVRPSGGDGSPEPAIFVARARPDGSVLLLGRSLVEIYELRQTVLRALAIASVPALALAFIIAALAARRTSLRLKEIHATLARIMRGDLTARLPERKVNDEIGRVSRDVNAMLEEISRLVSQLRNVGDNIAHDLRTPISVVRARLERSVEQSDEAGLRVSVRAALADLDRAMVTIAALLRLAEVENSPHATGFGSIDLAAICVDLFEFYEPLARAKSIAMTIEATPPASAMGDGDLLREALANLIDNAIKFTEAGGFVKIQAAMEDGLAVVRIHDSGPGVAQGDRDAIFGRFHRAGSTDRPLGVGLGLSIAAAIANLHEFDLRVEGGGPGSVFRLSPRR
jgi:signal transduction histidine kinase